MSLCPVGYHPKAGMTETIANNIRALAAEYGFDPLLYICDVGSDGPIVNPPPVDNPPTVDLSNQDKDFLYLMNPKGDDARVISPKNIFEEQGFPRSISHTQADLVGNYLTLGPIGKHSQYETLLVVAMALKLSKTPEGTKTLERLLSKYLDSMSKIISSMQQSSASNWLTAMMNQFQQTSIFERLGLISPYNALRTKEWLDHLFGLIVNTQYFENIVGGATTLVTGSTYESKTGQYEGESGAGLAAIAKILAQK